MRQLLLCCIVLLSTASPASAQISKFVIRWGDANRSTIMSCPGGDGDPLDAARTSGGVLDLRIRARIETDSPWTRTLKPADMPLDSVHLVVGDYTGVHPCTAQSVVIVADASYFDTETEEYVFSDTLDLGGYSPATVHVGAYYGGSFELSTGDRVSMYFVSPDISGDREVTLIDVQLFTADFYNDPTAIRSDFNDDEVVDLSDVSILGDHMQHSCSGAARTMLDGPATTEELMAMVLDLNHPLWGNTVPVEGSSWGTLKSRFRH